MKDKEKIVIICVGAVLVLALALAIYLLARQKNSLKEKDVKMEQMQGDIDEMNEIMEFEREQSIAEYEDIQQQYAEFSMTIDNDSLLRLVDEQQQKVEQLLQELKTVKSTNARRIAELKKELTTVRGVLKTYVAKVDSLNELNTSLRKENVKVNKKYKETSKKLEETTALAEELDRQVSLAKILEASDISLSTLNAKYKKTGTLRKIAKLKVDFRILRNITAERGLKTVYLRITDSAENLLPTQDHQFFTFEGNELEYSAKKEFEFDGENQNITIYFPITGKLQEGTYNIAIFADGCLIGEKSFNLE